MRKKILFMIDTGGPGGAETVFLKLIENLDKNKYYPYVILKGQGWVYEEVVKIGFSPEIIKMEGSFNLAFLIRLIGIIWKKRIDLIHSHLFGSNVYCSLAGIFCQVPVISSFHGTVDASPNGRMVRLKFRLINQGSKFVVFVSEHLKENYWKYTPVSRKKSITIYNGIDCQRFLNPRNKGFRKKWGYNENDVLIGSIGNIRMAKGYDILLKATSLIIKSFPKCKFVIVGEGKGILYEDLITLRNKLGLENVVNFLGFRPDIEEILNGLDLFVLPSTTEGFSISTIEAMAAGKPVIVTNSGGPAEIITHLKDGMLVEPNNPQAIADGIDRCLRDHQLRVSLSTNAMKTVQARFSIEKMLEKYSELYLKALSF